MINEHRHERKNVQGEIIKERVTQQAFKSVFYFVPSFLILYLHLGGRVPQTPACIFSRGLSFHTIPEKTDNTDTDF